MLFRLAFLGPVSVSLCCERLMSDIVITNPLCKKKRACLSPRTRPGRAGGSLIHLRRVWAAVQNFRPHVTSVSLPTSALSSGVGVVFYRRRCLNWAPTTRRATATKKPTTHTHTRTHLAEDYKPKKKKTVFGRSRARGSGFQRFIQIAA